MKEALVMIYALTCQVAETRGANAAVRYCCICNVMYVCIFMLIMSITVIFCTSSKSSVQKCLHLAELLEVESAQVQNLLLATKQENSTMHPS